MRDILIFILSAGCVLLFAWFRASRHAKLIEKGIPIGHGESYEGKEFIAAGFAIVTTGMTHHVHYGLLLGGLLGIAFPLILNRKRGLPYNYLGVEEDNGPGPEDSWFDIIQYRYLYPYHVILWITLWILLLIAYIYSI